MVYAGFWRRFASLWIDLFVFLPITVLVGWASSYSRAAGLALILPAACLVWGYHVYFHARWGQTIGKMAMRIRVVDTSGSPIRLTQAVLRSSPDIALGLAFIAVNIWAILQIPASQYAALGWWARQLRLAELTSQWRWVSWLQTAWFWSEAVTMLFNERRRALHDYLAGTVVVRVEPAVTREAMKIKDAGFWTPGSATLLPGPHVTKDTLRQDLNQFFGPRGYKTAVLRGYVVLGKSAWAGVAITLLHEPQGTTLRFVATRAPILIMVPSVVAGLVGFGVAIRLGMGLGGLGMILLGLIGALGAMPLVLITLLIAYFNAGKPLLAEFRGYLDQSPLLQKQPQDDGYGAAEKDAQKAARRKATRTAKKKALAAEKTLVEKKADEDGGAS